LATKSRGAGKVLSVGAPGAEAALTKAAIEGAKVEIGIGRPDLLFLTASSSAVRGDITRRGLGLRGDDGLATQVSEIAHGAASVSFGLELKIRARSTCRERGGESRRPRLPPPADHGVAAEHRLGERGSGWTASFSVLSGRCALLPAAPALPARRDAPVDVVPVDHRVGATADITRRRRHDARLAEEPIPLGHDRPLWEMWICKDAGERPIAIAGKVHHCMIDGIVAVKLASLLLDPTPSSRPAISTVKRRYLPLIRKDLRTGLGSALPASSTATTVRRWRPGPTSNETVGWQAERCWLSRPQRKRAGSEEPRWRMARTISCEQRRRG
jgi:wax ester synthase-like acyl-CoA acyltransferase family protein